MELEEKDDLGVVFIVGGDLPIPRSILGLMMI